MKPNALPIYVSLLSWLGFVSAYRDLRLRPPSLQFYDPDPPEYDTIAAAAATAQSAISNQQSNTRSPSQPLPLQDFDSAEVFQTLNFDANWTKYKLFWRSRDFNFEERYLREQTCFSNDQDQCQIPSLEVFVVPFSHNDPGWLQTFEKYFDTKTRFIIDNAIEKLNQYQDMTFVWSEISFLSKWWNAVANSTQKRMLRKLLNDGRFEILTGGWVMPDEASPSIFGLTHQLIEGHHWLKRNLNYKPVSAWSIDPFGHGNVMPYLLKSAGLEGMMIQRLHYAWKHWLAEHKNGDFRWIQRWDEEGKHGIHCLNAPYDLYPTKHSCGPVPETCMKFNFRHIPGKESEEHLSYMTPVTNQNILELADALMGQYRRTASLTRHNVVVTGLGNDFEFDDPLEWDQQYLNYAKLFQFINNNPQRYNARVRFGTLSNYFKTLKERQVQLPSFRGDFFPYSDIYFPYPPAYWTGYYSTRPFWKKLSRETEDELRKAEILFTFTWNLFRQSNHSKEAGALGQNFNYLVQARRWLALFQHHDGITGTSPRPTMVDYARKLFDSIRFSENIQMACAKLLIQRQLLQQNAYDPMVSDTFANLADQVPLKFTGDDSSVVKKVVLFNNHGWERSHLVRVLIDNHDVAVYGPQGDPVTSQINPKIGISDDGGESGIFSGYYELVFMAYLPPMALTTYEIRRESSQESPTLAIPASVQCNNCGYQIDPVPKPYVTLDNDLIGANYDATSGLLKGIYYKKNQASAMVNLTFGKYQTGFGSGAYLSRPIIDNRMTSDLMAPCKDDPTAQLFVVTGPVLKEITMICKEMMISSYVLMQGYPEFLTAVHLTNAVSPQGTNYGEYFMRIQTDLETTARNKFTHLEEPVFFAGNDLNVERRMIVSRLPYEGNLYPVVNSAYIQDPYTGRRVSILVDRSHGFTSTKSGNLEMIFDRRMPYDDARGMDEGVSDPEDMVSNYVILLEPFKSGTGREDRNTAWMPTLEAQRASKFLNYQPTLFVYDYPGNKNKPTQNFQNPPQTQGRISLFTKEFPRDAFLLHFRTTAGSSRGVPGRKALMVLQNLGYMNSKAGNQSRVLGTDLKLSHFAMPTDLVGDIGIGVEGQYQVGDGNYLTRTSLAPRGKPFELSSYMLQF